MAPTPSKNETSDKLSIDAKTQDTALTDQAALSELHDDEAKELKEACQRADDAVISDALAKDSEAVDVSAFMTAKPDSIAMETEKSCENVAPDAVSGTLASSDTVSTPDVPVTPDVAPTISSVESDLAAEEAALAAEALAITARMGEEEKAKEAAQAERKAKVEEALSKKPNRTKIAPAPEPRKKPNPEKEDEEEEEPLTLLGHLAELRLRVTRCFIAIGLGFILCYSFAERIFNELMVPLVSAMPPDSKLIFTALPEAFFVYMQVALVAAMFLVSPYIFYQIWSFISPGLYEEEKKSAIPVAVFSAVFFIGGASFCYFQVFPYAFQFFMGFATDLILPMPSLSEYLSFALKMLIAFGLIFEMPLFAFFLSRVGIVTAAHMRKFRKYAILCMFIMAAILTPPDVFSQTLMAGPMILLYEISILIAAAVGKKKGEADEEEADKDATKQNADRPMQGD